ncbi:MAG: nucleotide exchange factor GrpE [Buchnera aphidicola (Nurudea shiraii)]
MEDQLLKHNDRNNNENLKCDDIILEDNTNYIQDISILNKKIKDLEKNMLDKTLLSREKIKLYRHRTDKDIENTYKFSLSNFINALLPIIDNIERSLKLFDKEDKILNPIFIKLQDLLNSFLKLLREFGLKEIKKSKIPFNPDIHQAMATQNFKNIEENYVVSIMQVGYLLNGRLLRPAMVIVSKS